jgi:hypothetical protein
MRTDADERKSAELLRGRNMVEKAGARNMLRV